MNHLFSLLVGLLFIFVACFTFMSCSQSSTDLPLKNSERLIQRAGAPSVQAIKQATQAYVLIQNSGRKVILTSEQWSHLQQVLLNDHSYRFDHQKRCPFFPEYTLYVRHNSTDQAFRFSLSCAKMEFTGPVLIDCDPLVSEFKQILESNK